MLKKYSLLSLQKAINYALSLDENSPEKVQPLAGKLIELVIKPLDFHFFITVSDKTFVLLESTEIKPDTVIQTSPLGLIRLSILPASKARSLFNDKITLEGDVEAGQQLKKIFDSLDIDWEAQIAHFTGDVVAHQLGSWFRQGRAFKNQFFESMQLNTTDYLQEEIRLLPSAEEIQDFFTAVDELVMAADRLEAKIHFVLMPHDKTN